MNNALLKLEKVGLKINGVTKSILQNISYQIHSGDFVILLGHNGSGKSSLLKILDQRYSSTHGQIDFAERPLHHYSNKTLAQKVTTITQHSADSLFNSLSVLENCLLALQRRPKSLPSLNLSDKNNFFAQYLAEFNTNLRHKLKTPVEKLSGGEQQALVLALSVLNPPQLLLLDEHTSALDPQAAKRLMALTAAMIQKHHITCVLSTHELEIATQYGNRILALQNGEILRCIEKAEKSKLKSKDLLKLCY
jgi:putative tryptophan/tyrosine transport system ATP-binding protein